MVEKYISFGLTHPNIDLKLLRHEVSQQLLKACWAHSAFNVIELREQTYFDGKIADVIVVDCQNGAIPSRNSVGIKQQERLALVYCKRTPEALPHEVRPLRYDFPITMHQNAVPKNEPSSLCLYFESWPLLERTWTPQKHLERILWWLYETSRDMLHRLDQPVERLYFQSPWQIIFPPDFDKKLSNAAIKMQLTLIRDFEDAQKIIRADYTYEENSLSDKFSSVSLRS